MRRFFLLLSFLLIVGAGLVGWWYFNVDYPIKYEHEIDTALNETWPGQADKYKTLMLAMVRSESSFDANVNSKAGAVGLMQLMPATAQMMATQIGLTNYSDEQLLNPAVNLRLGAAYVKYLLDQYNNNTELMLASYNAGPNAAKLWETGQTVASETASYVPTVLRRQQGYQQRLRLRQWYQKAR